MSARLGLMRARAEAWREGRPWATNAVLLLLGFALLALTRQFVSESDHFTIGFSGASGWSSIVFVTAVCVVLTQPADKWTPRIVVAFAVLCRLVPLFADPFLSSDIYRYVWDGIVQHAGVNPYRYVPGDAALHALRAPNQDIFDNINRREYARTIYPPVAQMIYFAVTWISPTVAMMKTAMVGFECVTVAGLAVLLRRMGRPVSQVLLYAWCPLVIWEVGDAGHIDAAVAAMIVLAVVFRMRGNDWMTGLFLGLAVFTKFFPLVLFPALWRRGDWRMPTAVVAVGAVSYGMYASVGKLVFGFLGGYSQEEGLQTGVRYFLLEWMHGFAPLRNVSARTFLLLCGLVFAVLVWWAWRYATVEAVGPRMDGAWFERRSPAVVRACAMLAMALMLLFSPHYPWYLIWVVALFAMAPSLPVLVYVVAFFYGFTTQWADPGPKMFLLNRCIYGATLAAMIVQIALMRWPVHRRLFLDNRV